jgi:TM2 domain-containing membrane protein YozV
MMHTGSSVAAVLLLLISVPINSRSQTPDSLLQPESPAALVKSPELAGTLSWILPGLGQIYNGKVGRGLLQMELFFGGIGMIASSHIGFSHNSITPAAWVSVGIVASTFVWSVIDAITTAETINHEGRRATHLMEIRPGDTAIRFNLDADHLGARASILVTF